MQIDLDIVLYIAGLITAVSAAAAVITKLVKKSVGNISEEISKKMIEANEKKIESQIEAKFHTLEERMDKAIEKWDKAEADSKRLSINMACIRIDESHDYFKKKGYIPTYEMSLLEDIFADYQRLGGNHMAEGQMIELRKLPSEPPHKLTK